MRPTTLFLIFVNSFLLCEGGCRQDDLQVCVNNSTDVLAKVKREALSQTFKMGSVAININCGHGGCRDFLFDFSEVSHAVVKRAVSQGMNFMTKISKAKSKLWKIGNKRSAEYSHARFLGQNFGVSSMEQLSFVGMYTAKTLMTTMGIKQSQYIQFNFANAKLQGTLMEIACPRRPFCDPTSKYRSFDGTCNNLGNPKLGMANSPLRRLIPNQYDDGLGTPRTRSAAGGSLPVARTVSNICSNTYVDDNAQFTTLLPAFGQFLDHDLDHVPIPRSDGDEPLDCCSSQALSLEEQMLCFPIRIEPNDPNFRGRSPCINIVRSMSSPFADCQPGPREQLNQISHWIDASNVYGSSLNVSTSLRMFRGGLLKTVRCEDGTECLPFSSQNECRGPSTRCALAGDLRVNEQPTLGMMHLLFVREHNRLARGLQKVNPHWNDETLFQEARRILIAEWQHIIYNEFLPTLLGSQPALKPLKSGFRHSYDSGLDARVSNAFAAAAFRIGHTFVPSLSQLYSLVSNQVQQTFTLKDIFANADIIRQNGNFDRFLKGVTLQACEKFDNTFADSLKNQLFADGKHGIDLVAINLQRGRDHGLPSYVHFRRACNVGDAKKFSDLASNMRPEKIQLLAQAYKRVEDIDLFMGGVMEDNCQGTFIGCTLACIIADTFDRLRRGDRFFYDNADQPGSFTSAQLKQIRKVTMARLICDNSHIQTTTRFAFLLPNPVDNPSVACTKQILGMDLSVFADRSFKPELPLDSFLALRDGFE